MIKKATLNMYHSETIVEIFRFCIRKDSFLSVALDTNFEGWDCKESSQKTEMQEQALDPIQTNPMELEVQARCEWLCSNKLLISQFEATMDSLTGMDKECLMNS